MRGLCPGAGRPVAVAPPWADTGKDIASTAAAAHRANTRLPLFCCCIACLLNLKSPDPGRGIFRALPRGRLPYCPALPRHRHPCANSPITRSRGARIACRAACASPATSALKMR
ncbi:hypothetical protein G6F22_020946 [Rhizopus arrhizus]|nr:hypothetical protein G6F22_020946 [Rhizopus arrhizus]